MRFTEQEEARLVPYLKLSAALEQAEMDTLGRPSGVFVTAIKGSGEGLIVSVPRDAVEWLVDIITWGSMMPPKMVVRTPAKAETHPRQMTVDECIAEVENTPPGYLEGIARTVYEKGGLG